MINASITNSIIYTDDNIYNNNVIVVVENMTTTDAVSKYKHDEKLCVFILAPNIQYNNQGDNYMKKNVYILEGLDCANCAAKVEEAVKKIDGVNDATVNFMAQKMVLDADDARFDEILQEVIAVAKKVEPDCELYL